MFDPDQAARPSSGIYGLPHRPEEAGVVLVPVPFEATTSYGGGTSGGPGAILRASRQVDLFDLETGRPYEAGIALLPEDPSVQAWNAEACRLARPALAAGGAALPEHAHQVDTIGERLNAWVFDTTVNWLEQGRLVGLVGGDHATPFGAIQAHAQRFPGLGILHLDAHADLRDAYEGFTWSHASIMHNVLTRLGGVAKVVQVGVRDLGVAEHAFIERCAGRVVTFYDAHLKAAAFAGVPWREQVDRIVAALPADVYLSFDIDGLDPTLCPHTGTPVPGGLSFAEACALLEGVVRARKRIVGFDLVEVAPDPAGGDWDGNVAARLLYKMIGQALRSR